MKYAVISFSGSQYLAQKGDIITTANLNQPPNTSASTDQVLLVVGPKTTKIGQPLVKDAKVEYQVLKNYSGKKIKVFKYKAKSHYRRHKGFRPQLTEIKITKISVKTPSPKSKSPKSKKSEIKSL